MNFTKLEAIKAFVGEDYSITNLPEKAVKLMERYDARSQHYDIRDQQEY